MQMTSFTYLFSQIYFLLFADERMRFRSGIAQHHEQDHPYYTQNAEDVEYDGPIVGGCYKSSAHRISHYSSWKNIIR